jgi:hypothetical protein
MKSPKIDLAKLNRCLVSYGYDPIAKIAASDTLQSLVEQVVSERLEKLKHANSQWDAVQNAWDLIHEERVPIDDIMADLESGEDPAVRRDHRRVVERCQPIYDAYAVTQQQVHQLIEANEVPTVPLAQRQGALITALQLARILDDPELVMNLAEQVIGITKQLNLERQQAQADRAHQQTFEQQLIEMKLANSFAITFRGTLCALSDQYEATYGLSEKEGTALHDLLAYTVGEVNSEEMEITLQLRPVSKK